MNEKILKNIIENKKKLVPLIFTEKQMKVVEKHLFGKKLSNAEKKALYTSVKKKIEALEMFSTADEGYYINGGHCIIKERIEEAKRIIEGLKGKKAFVAGSFLYSRKYGDIDVYILVERGYKEEFKEIGKETYHMIHITEKRLKNAVFQSSALISVSNFDNIRDYKYKVPQLNTLMSTYHEAIIEIKRKERKKEAVRDLIFKHFLINKDVLINGFELANEVAKADEGRVDNIIKELCQRIYSKSYLYMRIHEYLMILEEDIKENKNNSHLICYKKTYEEMIYGRKRDEAKAV